MGLVHYFFYHHYLGCYLNYSPDTNINVLSMGTKILFYSWHKSMKIDKQSERGACNGVTIYSIT